MKGIVAAATSIVFGLLLCVGLLEVAVRLFSHGSGSQTVSDRPLKYFLPEKSKSLRDYSYEPEKPANTYRIAVIGDSFAFGFNNFFDDAFPKRLERLLNLNEHQAKVEVLNFGTPGLSTKQELRFVHTALDHYAPDLLILEITLNDPELVPYSNPRGFLGDRMNGGKGSGGILEHWKGLSFILTRLDNRRAQQEYVRYFQSLYDNPASRSAFESALSEIAESCKKANVKLLAVVFPLFARPLDASYPFTSVHETIGKILAERQIPELDLLPRFRGMTHERLEAIPGVDPHPNEIAHRIASEEIQSYLAKSHLVPDDVIPVMQVARREQKKFLPEGRP